MDLSPFKRFFRPTGKYLASRFSATGSIRISPVEVDGRIVSSPDVVIAITRLDAKRYHREYERQIREGALVEVKPEVFEAYATKKSTGATGAADGGEDAGDTAEDAASKKRKRRTTGGES